MTMLTQKKLNLQMKILKIAKGLNKFTLPDILPMLEENEKTIQKALNELSKNKTVIMIAHRLSTVKNADCIFVLQNGKLIEQGKTEELCSQNGVFASMLKNYLTSVKWKVGKEELK